MSRYLDRLKLGISEFWGNEIVSLPERRRYRMDGSVVHDLVRLELRSIGTGGAFGFFRDGEEQPIAGVVRRVTIDMAGVDHKRMTIIAVPYPHAARVLTARRVEIDCAGVIFRSENDEIQVLWEDTGIPEIFRCDAERDVVVSRIGDGARDRGYSLSVMPRDRGAA